MIKSIISTLFMCYFCLVLQAQEEEQHKAPESYQFLLASHETSQTGFGSLFIAIGKIKETPALMMGGGGGLLFNQQFFCGGYGMGLAGELETQLNTGEALSYRFRHGGIYLGYNFFPKKAVHLSLGLKGGFGRIRQEALLDTEGPSPFYMFDKVQVLSPELSIQMNLLPWFRLDLGASYQAVMGIKPNDFYTEDDFNQFMGIVNLSFGWFKGH